MRQPSTKLSCKQIGEVKRGSPMNSVLFCVTGTVHTAPSLLRCSREEGWACSSTNTPWLISLTQRCAADQGRHHSFSFTGKPSDTTAVKTGATRGQGIQSLRKPLNCREGKSQSLSFFLACTQTWGATCVSLALTPKREKKKRIVLSKHTN